MRKNKSETIETRSQWSSSQEIHFRVNKKARPGTDRAHMWHPPTDLFESEKIFVVRVEIAGMEHAEMTISLEGSILAVHGVRRQANEATAYYQMEVRFGEFLSLVELPAPVDSEQISVAYDDGFLRVTLPKVDV